MEPIEFAKGDILIVDDTLENLKLLSRMLIERNYEVRSVTSGSTALMGIQAQPPDLILLDINMPGMNGYEVCQQLKSLPSTQAIPVIFISAVHETIDKVKAFSVGGADFITKPFQLEEVFARVEHQLKLCHLQQQLQAKNQRLQQAEADLRQSLDQERALNQRLEELVALEERNRIARDLHDSLGHALVALNIQLETVLNLWSRDTDRAYQVLQEAKQFGVTALDSVRQSVSAIRSDPLAGQLLEGAIASLTQDFYHMTDILPECQIDLAQPLSNQVHHVVYRIIQEGLTNICKHAAATQVRIHIQTSEAGLFLVLQDNGKGISADQRMTGYGLQGMRERTAAMNGQLEIISKPGAGCRIQAKFPRTQGTTTAFFSRPVHLNSEANYHDQCCILTDSLSHH